MMISLPEDSGVGTSPEFELERVLLALARSPVEDPQAALQAILDAGGHILHSTLAELWTLDGDGLSARARWPGEPSSATPGDCPSPGDVSLLRERSLLVHSRSAALKGVHAERLDAAVWQGGEVTAILRFERATPGEWSAAERLFVSALAERAAAAFEQERVQRRRVPAWGATDHHEAGAAPRASEESYRAIFEGATDAIYILHPATGAILDANPAACEMNGYPVEELRRLGIGGVSTGEFPFTWDNALALVRLAASGVPQRLEWSARHSSGRLIWGDVTLRHVTILGEDRVLATARDITERKAAEEALQRANAELERRVEERTAELQEREEHFRRLIENASDMVQLIDATGQIRYTGPSVHHLLGYTPEEIAGTDPLIYIHPEDQQETATALGEMLAHPGVTRVARYRVRHREGHYRYFEAFARTLSSASAAEGVVVNARDVTERVETDRLLQERERYFRRLIENSYDLVQVIDARGQISYTGPSVTRLLGYTPEEVMGTTAPDFIHPEDVPRIQALMQAVFTRPGVAQSLEYRVRHRDGSWRWLEAFACTLSPDSPADGIVANARDVTDRREAERRLQEREEHFRKLIETAHDLIQTFDVRGRVMYTGPSVQRLLGYTPEEAEGFGPEEFIHPDDLSAVQTALERALSSPGEPVNVEYRARHKNGGWRWFEAIGRTLSPDTAEDGVVANARDVTERREAEAELERQRAYFEQLIVCVDAGIAAWDAAGRFEYVSPGASFDSPMRRWIIGRTHREYCEKRGLPSSVADLRQHFLTRALESRAPTEFEETLHRPDGSARRVLRRYLPVLDRAGEVERVIGYSIDITERNRAEEALRQASEEAERARDAAERANRAKSEFLSRMSHELRTPMNSILGFAQLLDRAPLTPEQKKGVGHILKAGRHLLQLINEVLEIARIEAGRHSLSLEPVSLGSVLQEAVGLVRPLAVQLHVDLDEGPWSCGGAFVHADRQRLTQVLLNLLANAVKYNRPGGRVRVICEPLEGGEMPPRLVVRISDTGPGIPLDRADQLFTPFARLGAEQSDVEGTGLGLALSQRLAEAMGGALTLESTGPEGSVFRLELSRAEDPMASLDEASAPAGPIDGVPHRQATLLYVEDNLANLSLVETILQARPHWRTLPALQGQLGLELAREHLPDLILLDLHLPDISGAEVLRRLRTDRRTAGIPVVVISADATSRSVEHLREAGADAYLTKPLDIDEFMATLERFLGETAS